MVQYEILVEGRVQRVGYRNFARRYAERCEIKGWVKNTRDGKVQLMVQGSKTNMETFIDFLKFGPPMSDVTNVIRKSVTVSDTFNGFNVIY